MDEDVGGPGQGPNDFGTARMIEVDTNAALITVVAKIWARLSVPQRRKSPNVIASIWTLDLDDISSEIAEKLSTIGTSNILRQIDDSNSVQRHHLFMARGCDATL